MAKSVLRGIDVVVLAGGLGSRVRNVLGDTPKVLAPVHGKTFLDHLLNHMSELGAERVILSLGFLADKVKSHLKDHPPTLSVETVVEPMPLGTGGALRFVIPYLTTSPILVVNGDTWLDTDYEAFVTHHKASHKPCSILCVEVDDTSRYGSIQLADDGAVLKFIEKGDAKGTGIISGGVYLFERRAINELAKSEGLSLERDFLSVVEPKLLNGYVAKNATFIDIGTPETLKAADRVITPRDTKN